jgi:hypothetical protein
VSDDRAINLDFHGIFNGHARVQGALGISRLIESYLDAITGKDPGSIKSSSLIEGLSGIIKLPRKFRLQEGQWIKRSPILL